MPCSTRRVLLVTDDPALDTAVRRALPAARYAIARCAPRETMTSVAADQATVVVLDRRAAASAEIARALADHPWAARVDLGPPAALDADLPAPVATLAIDAVAHGLRDAVEQAWHRHPPEVHACEIQISLTATNARLAASEARLAALVAEQRADAARQRAILAALPDPLIILDGQLRVVEIHPGARPLPGLGPALPEGLADAIAPACREARDRREVITRATSWISADGERHLELQIAPHGDGLVASLHDVTAVRAQLAELDRGEVLLHRSQALGGVGSWEVDLARDVVTWSAGMYEITGRDRPPANYPEALAAMHPEDRDHFRAVYESALARGAGGDCELRVFHASGEIRTHWISWQPRLAEGRVLGISLDVTERRAAQDAIRRSERLLAESQAVARIGSFSLEGDGDQVTLSAQARVLLALPADRTTLPRDELLALLVGDHAARARAWLAALRAGRAASVLDVRARIAGRVRNLRVTGGVFVSGDHGAHVVGTIQDITERHRKDAAQAFLSTGLAHRHGPALFEHMARRLAEILEVEMAFIGEMDEDHEERVQPIAMVIDGAARRVDPYDVGGTPCAHLCQGQAVVFARDVAAQFPGAPGLAEVGASGYAAMPLLDREGHVIGTIGVMSRAPILPADHEQLVDVLALFALRCAPELARARADAKLQRASAALLAHEEAQRRVSENHLAHLIRTSGAVLYNRAVDPPYAFTYVSPNAATLLGVTDAALVATPDALTARIHPDDVRQLREALAKVAVAREVECEYRVLRGTDVVWVSDHLRTIEDAPIAGYWTDITGRKRLERQLAETADAAVEANRMKNAFLATMSHELRTPLNAVLGLSEAMLEGTFGGLTARQQRGLETIHTSGQHLLGLINDVLDVARIEAGSFALELRPVVLVPLIAECVGLVDKQAGDRNARIEVDHAVDVDAVLVDPRRMRQVLINLLSNALKFAPPGSRIEVQTRMSPSGMIAIAVRDQGPGIAPADQRRIFEPFVVLDPSTARRESGVGLGLALVKRLLELMGGAVQVESELGRGSTFVALVPPADAYVVRHAQPPRPRPRGAIAPRRDRTVLLVEDNDASIETFESYLEAHGYQVRVVRTGEAAIEAAAWPETGIILLDLQLPGIDGLTALRRIRDQGIAVPVVALTAYAMVGDAERCYQAGATTYMSKPVDLVTLRTTIASLLA